MDESVPALPDIFANPDHRALRQRLDRLAMPADAKVIMARLLETSAEVAGRVIAVGGHILAFVLDLVARFPNTALGAIVGLTVSMLIGSVPLLGAILGPILGPLLAAFLITGGALADMRNGTIARQIDALCQRFDSALAHA